MKKLGFDGISCLDVALGALKAVLLVYPTKDEIDDDEGFSEFGSPLPTKSPLQSL